MTRITLITAQSDLLSVDGQIGFLCETAPDGALAARYPDALTMAAAIGDLSATKQRAGEACITCRFPASAFRKA